MSFLITVAEGDEVVICITIEQAARQSGYNEQYIRRLMRSGKINGVKVSRIWLVEADSLAEYLKAVRSTQMDDARFGPLRSAQGA